MHFEQLVSLVLFAILRMPTLVFLKGFVSNFSMPQILRVMRGPFLRGFEFLKADYSKVNKKDECPKHI